MRFCSLPFLPMFAHLIAQYAVQHAGARSNRGCKAKEGQRAGAALGKSDVALAELRRRDGANPPLDTRETTPAFERGARRRVFC
jgi:hypothetical protein